MPSYVNLAATTSTTASINPTTGNTYLADTINQYRNMFLSCSFIRTVQSGSPDDLNTLPSVTTGNIFITYDIFAFNDSWQATQPLFIKIEYRSSLYSNTVQLVAEMGSVHNNSGSIVSTDKIALGSTTNNYGEAVAVIDKIYASGDGSYIAIANTVTHTPSCQVLLCERFYDQYGQPTGSGFHMVNVRSGATFDQALVAQQATMYGEAAPTAEQYNVVHTRPNRVPSIYGGNLILGLVYPFVGKPMNPSPNLLFGESTTFSTNYSTVEYSVYGQPNTYINTGGVLGTNQRIVSNGRWLMRI